MNNIAFRQNEQKQLERLAAQREIYSFSKKLYQFQIILTVIIPISLFIISSIWNTLVVYSALFGILVFIVDGIFLQPTIKKKKLKAAKIQELFDCDILDLEISPLPARHLVDMESYHYTIDGNKATSLISQLGCSFKCQFCGGRYSPFLRKIRSRSSARVIEEIRELYETYGFTGFMFYDDELNINKSWEPLLEDLIKLQSELNVEMKFRGFVKAELFTQRQADLMYRAGFRWLLTGFESGDERILKNS